MEPYYYRLKNCFILFNFGSNNNYNNAARDRCNILSDIKINISDYPKVKEDQRLHSFNRQLKATAANHNTLEVLDTTYVPPTNLTTSFYQLQKFIYNVYTQCVTTTKGKVCVRMYLTTNDARQVYKDLLAAFDDPIFSSLDSSTLRSELTVMKRNDKWRIGFESKLTYWLAKFKRWNPLKTKVLMMTPNAFGLLTHFWTE
jgi:hypothetical protein